MTNKELFERYGGAFVLCRETDYPFQKGQYYRVCGYRKLEDEDDQDSVVFEVEPQYAEGFWYAKLLEGLPPDWAGRYSHHKHWDWNSVRLPKTASNLCCRCGNLYKNKAEHVKVCK